MPKLVHDFDAGPPPYKSPHPAFTGTARVLASAAVNAKDLGGLGYDVDLDKGTCTCRLGQPFEWHNKQQKWTPFMACSHKLRAMADIIERAGRPADMTWEYTKALALRYNKYEAVSAFHKELRRGDVEKAVFWGSILMAFRGLPGVYKYLLNILYEELRDHTLGAVLLERCIHKDQQSYADLCKLIKLFCEAKKKWELPHRYAFLEAEMGGYARLVKAFGRDVAKAGDIIAFKHKPVLLAALEKGLKENDLLTFQFGLKGLQKSQTSNIDKLRADVANRLSAMVPKKPNGYKELEAYIGRRASHGLGIGYHELNAFGDLLTGEPYAAGCTASERIKAVLAAPAPPLRLGVAPSIPVYAHDNHTWAGKAAIRKYPHEYLPNADQQNMDLRLCGAYLGVTYRHLAYKQYGDVFVQWRSVDWPVWLAKTVQQLWY